MMSTPDRLLFRGGWALAFVPVLVFLSFCVLYFVVLDAFDMTALAMGGFVALLVGALFARGNDRYWEAVTRGIGSPTSVSILVILLVIGMFSSLIKETDVASGFVWVANQLGASGAVFTLFTFVTVCVVAMATGSSIGTMFTAFPIFYPAGVLLGASPELLAGAVISGAIFGDNLAPISDTTIISSSTQKFRTRPGIADIAGVVRSRAKYALVAALVSAIGFLLIGGGSAGGEGASEILAASEDATSLIMLVPVVIMLAVAFATRSIFKAVTVGLVLGTAAGLGLDLIDLGDVIGVEDGVPTGFLVSGISGMLGTVALVTAVFGIMGVLTEAGVLDRIVDAMTRSSLASTPRGAEAAIGLGISGTTLLFGGVNSASMLTFGPVADEIGSRVGLHPYRRANVMDCFAMGVACVVPLFSVFLIIGTQLTSGFEQVPAISLASIFPATLYPLVLTAVMIVSVATGWGRRFEGDGGQEERSGHPVRLTSRTESSGPERFQ